MRHIANMEQEVKGEEWATTHNPIPHGIDLCQSLTQGWRNAKVAKVLAFALFELQASTLSFREVSKHDCTSVW